MSDVSHITISEDLTIYNALELKQRLMSLDSPLLRLELVSDLLEQLRIDSSR